MLIVAYCFTKWCAMSYETGMTMQRRANERAKLFEKSLGDDYRATKILGAIHDRAGRHWTAMMMTFRRTMNLRTMTGPTADPSPPSSDGRAACQRSFDGGTETSVLPFLSS